MSSSILNINNAISVTNTKCQPKGICQVLELGEVNII